ncbi:MAG: hypothetical protein DYG94_01735 [Leptolyngbya sp. PLA3]|nr:MAG: hypothetical protein EDM82_00150 [Cyanobacteria bacterium CYA]MCE7967453.1 hypothetical protein [Leptolyngbya sp. PL-A3]
MKKTWKNGWLGRVSALPLLCVGVPALVAGSSVPAEARAVAIAGEELDQVIFRDGKIVKGVIDKETEETVSLFVVVGTIRGTVATVYQKKDILSIIRGSGEKTTTTDQDAPEVRPAVQTPDESATTSKKVVYHIKLDGILGRDFNVTPLKDAVNAARALEPDYLLIELDNLWRYGSDESKGRFDEFGIADEIEPVLRQNIQTHWKKQPQLVVWVKNAMGGAAFIPFFTSNVYFTSDGRMGGIGDLGDLFGSTGDEVVRDKQKSLRLARAKGMAIPNGYDERLVEAMTWRTYVLYYTMEGGKPKYHTEPVPGAELLTDSGEGEFEDTMEQRVRGEGNDALTLKAELAQKLGVSKGTADSIEDLMFYLGILDNYELVSDKSERVMERWSETIDRLEQEIPAMFREFNEINANGQDYNARKQARGAQINILKKIIQKVERYQESLQWSRIGVPPLDQLRVMIEQIRLQQIADRP